ncbi:CU044_5270 family protein [Streptomyces sp. NRRL B-24085]|uniref:CU044_5270 family protein n=1 Tax=Streptomyces sp. NRRL B-24085 TaxID=1709476 RepID=UPI0006B3B393|nr:CU044_5270 family protein [Streptomyces sp. NRRL B-24085]
MNEAEELLATAEWDLPPERHRHFKDVLMQRIDDDENRAAKPSVRRRLARPAVLVPLVSAALAGALLTTLTTDGQPPQTPATSASGTLNRIATAAMASDTVRVRDDQFVYVRTLDRSNTGGFGGPVRLGALHTEESWTAQDPGPLKVTGWLRSSGKDAVMPGQLIPVESADTVPAGVLHPTYRWLASLPTDPDALLRRLREEARPVEGESRDQAVFSLIGDLIGGTVMPPANAAAFYRAAARLPGVREIPDAVDAAGRHGIAITLDDTGFATRHEWIFDKESLALLGSRFYLTDPDRGITTETLAGTSAVMETAVVDRKGEVPARAASR